ncbi:hypothetical protein [Muribaculum intestinale]|uniref:hypothetical protein n=1 Tax=Muribaculum intestinale TaxID=1796646 RepID=UPI003F677430
MSHYGRPDPQENALLERLIFNPVPDYALDSRRRGRAQSAPQVKKPTETPLTRS